MTLEPKAIGLLREEVAKLHGGLGAVVASLASLEHAAQQVTNRKAELNATGIAAASRAQIEAARRAVETILAGV
jgi:hypothetical protein